MRRLLVSAGIAFVLALGLIGGQAHALEVPKAPPLETPIVDQTGVLNAEQIKQLSAQIAKSRTEKSYQIGVLIISSLGNSEYLEGYSLKVARGWGIGEKEKSNGVLLLVALDDRKLRIEVGRGLEGDLTDVRSNRIIRNVITPKFKEGKYYEGISEGINSIQLAVAAKADPATEKDSEDDESNMLAQAIIFLTFFGFGAFAWLGAVLGRSKSWWAGGVIGGVAGFLLMLLFGFAIWAILGFIGLIFGGLGFDYLVSKNYKQHVASGSSPAWWAGGTWGGGSGWGGGSSGGGFGGGGFSGGGSSGSW